MIARTNRELKEIAKAGLLSTYGFTVNRLADITLLEASDDGCYIRFKVGANNEYVLESSLDRWNAVWTLPGCIYKAK